MNHFTSSVTPYNTRDLAIQQPHPKNEISIRPARKCTSHNKEAAPSITNQTDDSRSLTRFSHYRIVRLPELIMITGYARSTLYKWICEGTFPKPLKLGRTSGWLEAEVIRWIEALAETRPLD